MRTEKILVMGLPGSGRTELAQQLVEYLVFKNKTVDWFSADMIREKFNDWDFTESGRIRQAVRICEYANQSKCDFVVCDFVAPLPSIWQHFAASWTVWLDTIKQNQSQDTPQLFVEPTAYDFRIIEKNTDVHAKQIVDRILSV